FDFAEARQELDEASAIARPPDPALDGTLAYLRALLLARQGAWNESAPLLHQALGAFGREHFLTGMVLDHLGRVYAGKCNFDAAREFYQQAIVCKTATSDEDGLIVSNEELGRLYLEWGELDRAEEQLQAGLRLAQKRGADDCQAQLFNHLGRVALARAARELAAGKKAAARKQLARAAEYLDWSVAHNRSRGRGVQEGRALKDVALLR